MAVLSVVAAHVPERGRLLVWFPLAFGLFAGWKLTGLVEWFRVPFPRTITILAALLIAGRLAAGR